MRICKRFTFDAAHRLPLHDGKCSRLHGHTYTLEVEVRGPIKENKASDQGMVLDFAFLKQVVSEEVLLLVDHWNLNNRLYDAHWTNIDPETENVTTAENLVLMIRNVLVAKLYKYAGVELVRLRLHETPDSWAEWRIEDSN